MDLLKIYNENQKREKEFKKQKEEYALQKDINGFVVDIIRNEPEFYSNNKKAFEELGIKYKRKKKDYIRIGECFRCGDYYAPINKTNIKKLNDYINKRSNNEN